MATFKSLIDAQCGTANPLIQLSQIYSQDATRVLQNGIIQSVNTDVIEAHRPDSREATVNQFVQEYHQPPMAPATFQLDGLLSGLRVSDQRSVDHGWSNEFLDSTAMRQVPIHSQPTVQPNLWTQSTYRPTIPMPETSLLFRPTSFYPNQSNFLLPPMMVDDQTSQAAQNLLSYIQETQSNQHATPTTVPVSLAEIEEARIIAERAAASYYTSQHDRIVPSSSWSRSALESSDLYSEYKFSKTNDFLDHSNPYEEGLKRLEVHDIVNAVLFFEAAVQKQADHVNAWLYLGITQSENEQDRQAICALKKCIELDPKNLQAYITIASCYANESLMDNAMDSLQQWLTENPRYAHLAPKKVSTAHPEVAFIDEIAFEQLQQAFLQAISSSPDHIDPDLQVCLGILFHLACDYEKAAECFQTAVMAKPDDPQLWNKLGAALANGGESERAVDAYYHALTLSPGFVRARYNLGISCFNLHAYPQATEHFLTALKQQSEGIGPHGTQTQMSENIWRTLAMAVGHLNRPDLEANVIYKDLPKLLREFQIE